MRWNPGELQLPLDDEAEMRVMQGQIALGMLTVEDVMVRRNMARDLEAAKVKRAENLAKLKAQPMDWLVPFIKGESPQTSRPRKKRRPQSRVDRNDTPSHANWGMQMVIPRHFMRYGIRTHELLRLTALKAVLR